ncbi:acetyl-CoA hydrolase/transferase C-terminal domain-containing protein [Bosea sp. (in: a-proteobacteria)]|jgi:acyl-CoA hydrolase|uniref:acetyl-CoA hydrolase/transferase C-terminal domain-containing protein n=1 Tax=Bosea sp. (in: a-proteobacteria) TaxID=1871050 RepID=UPI003F6FFF97
MARPQVHDDPDAIADRIVEALDGKVVLGLPLGLGKAGRIANALYRRAAADKAVSLDIFTALTLEPPAPQADLERRFLEPIIERLFGRYERLAYAQALRDGKLPANITVSEFFLLAGRWLGVPSAQQRYVSANYTHAARMLLDKGVNVIAQLVAKTPSGEPGYSLSCNTDITLDILPALRADGRRFILAGEVSSQLPFMGGKAVLSEEAFELVLDRPQDEPGLFVVPKQPVSDADHAIGIHAASLVKDGGTIQIGIGSLGDALTAGLIMRHRAPELFERTLAALCHGRIPPNRETRPFERGLYAASEMFVDGFMELYRSGILKRQAEDGALLHAGFFLGTEAFYAFLRDLSEQERTLFQMRGISFVNELHGDEDRKRRDRAHARFVNNAMMTTLLGDTISDGLEDGAVVSGVGGQYNFVAQAFALDDARSIITLNASRAWRGRRQSRILWSYGHTTIPRHLRDVVITEYGVADLRGASDRDCIAAMLGITDAAFHGDLLRQARSAGKTEGGFALPAQAAANTPAFVSRALREAKAAGFCEDYPLGSDFTPVEQNLLSALSLLRERTASRGGMLKTAVSALASGGERQQSHSAELQRMRLDKASGIRERLSGRLLVWALDQRSGEDG